MESTRPLNAVHPTRAGSAADLHAALSRAVVLADGEAIDAADHLIDAVALFLGIDPTTITIGKPLPKGQPQRCPVCGTYHHGVGEKTDAGRLTRPCPRLSADDPRNRP